MRRYGLGRWPEMSISEAREAALRMRVRVKHGGEDPVAERRQKLAIGQDAAQGFFQLAARAVELGQDLHEHCTVKGGIESAQICPQAIGLGVGTKLGRCDEIVNQLPAMSSLKPSTRPRDQSMAVGLGFAGPARSTEGG